VKPDPEGLTYKLGSAIITVNCTENGITATDNIKAYVW